MLERLSWIKDVRFLLNVEYDTTLKPENRNAGKRGVLMVDKYLVLVTRRGSKGQ